ncbi:MAG: PrsW family intramembrane metalloprotease [Candidatus Dormibacteraeota bacterium]|uniref:PrsW family intramembrane metalloprotease n=1 Tax=Candidatus Amunia macphersoniae TaxID=3127014 RepID=A0A934KLF9_9BACT|nr:PrsW family intramembrane metalloprotease [Candidatus Dormibacteraeota bacterium]
MPDAVFCTACGAHQGTTGQSGNPRLRHTHYAAHPGEHVGQPSVFSTIFPHLGHGRIHEFRYAFLGALAVLILLVGTGLVVAALLGAIFLVPILYLVYLYEAQVYRDEPATVLGFTIGGGVILGLVVSIVADKVLQGTGKETTVGQIVGLTVILPIVQVIAMALPAVLLRGRPAFPETIDGFAFGVASGLGFSVAEGLVRFSNVFTDQGLQTDSANWIAPLLSVAILIPLLHGSAGGVVAASLWRRDRSGNARSLGLAGVVVAVALSIAFYLVGELLQINGVAALVVLAFQVLPVAALLVYARFLMHHALLEEAADMGFRPAVCPHCHRHIVAAGFCPSCGVAISAGPRSQADLGDPMAAGAAEVR